MAKPINRQEFKEYCLRKLGWPVVEINVDDDQVEDRIDESLAYFQDYHFDGTEVIYYKHQLEEYDFPDRVNSVMVLTGGTGYSNSDTITFSESADGSIATGTLTTDSNGSIISVNLDTYGNNYRLAPSYSISGSGAGANLEVSLGGFITLPQNIIGAVRIFDLSSSFVSDNMFSIQYQIALNDLYTLTSQSMVPYYITMTHLSLIQQILIGSQMIRYTRHRNRLHIDMNWDRVKPGTFVIVEAYETIDPSKFPDVWGDRFLAKYCTALIKKQWGNNMKKFSGMMLPGGVQFNGQQYYDEAVEELKEIEEEMMYTWSLPEAFYVG